MLVVDYDFLNTLKAFDKYFVHQPKHVFDLKTQLHHPSCAYIRKYSTIYHCKAIFSREKLSQVPHAPFGTLVWIVSRRLFLNGVIGYVNICWKQANETNRNEWVGFDYMCPGCSPTKIDLKTIWRTPRDTSRLWVDWTETNSLTVISLKYTKNKQSRYRSD